MARNAKSLSKKEFKKLSMSETYIDSPLTIVINENTQESHTFHRNDIVSVKATNKEHWQAKIMDIRVKMDKRHNRPESIWVMLQWFHQNMDVKHESFYSYMASNELVLSTEEQIMEAACIE
ncbi:hypothetical protein V8E55_007446, partial [Tylopilus felleus]